MAGTVLPGLLAAPAPMVARSVEKALRAMSAVADLMVLPRSPAGMGLSAIAAQLAQMRSTAPLLTFVIQARSLAVVEAKEERVALVEWVALAESVEPAAVAVMVALEQFTAAGLAAAADLVDQADLVVLVE
jgi:hypothetical protein